MAIKLVKSFFLFAKNETTLGGGAAMTASNYIQTVDENPVFTVEFADAGERGSGNASYGQLRRAGPSGRSTTATVTLDAKGAGTTYTTSVTPPNVHPFLLASGLSGSLSGSAWVYTPVEPTATPTSLALAVYAYQELTPVSGALCSFTFGSDSTSPSRFTFNVQGVPSDAAAVGSVPARTAQAEDVIPPANRGITVSLNGYSAKVRSYNFDAGNEVQARTNLTATDGIESFMLAGRAPSFTLTVERDDMSAFDPRALQKNATGVSGSLTIGSTAGNRIKLDISNGQITEVAEENDGVLGLWNLTATPHITAGDKNDDYKLTFL